MAANSRYILYRIFDASGALLYVGATTNPALRFNGHYHTQPWWDEAVEIKLQRLATVDELAAAELEAIETEQPRYNVLHSGRLPASWARKPRRSPGNGSIFRRKDGMWVASIETRTADGRRRQKRRYAKDRKTAELMLDSLKKELA